MAKKLPFNGPPYKTRSKILYTKHVNTTAHRNKILDSSSDEFMRQLLRYYAITFKCLEFNK